MNRRTFLGSAAGVVATWPTWLAAAFADEKETREKTAEDGAGLVVASEGFRRAQRSGKPLLALIIPTDAGEKWKRGSLFGEYLNHASLKERAPLALCEVVCTTMKQLQQLVPTVGQGEPLMVLVQTDRVPATAQQLHVQLPREDNESFGMPEKEVEQRIGARITTVAKLLRDAVMLDTAMLEKRAAQQRSSIPASVVEKIEEKLKANKDLDLTQDELDQGAAHIAWFASKQTAKRRDSLFELLGGVALFKVVRARVPGSKWGYQTGCGTRVEGEKDNMMVACGMGHVPAKSRRFLYFFTRRDF